MSSIRTCIITATLVAGYAGTLLAQPLNVAPLGVATQSTTGFGGEASRANDGNTNGAFGGNSVSHTNTGDPAPTWEVALDDSYPIDTISIWNRTDCCSERLTNFRVSVLDADLNEVFGVDLFTDLTFPSPSVDIDVGSVEGSVVRVARLGTIDKAPANSWFLSLAEVQVFTDAGNVPTSIRPQPAGAIVSEGHCHRFSVGLFNSEIADSITYQWKKDGEDIPGATGASLLVSDLTQDDAGDYSVCVDVDGTILVSDPATLEVTPRNLALGGTATQSTEGFGGAASRAIDGNTNGIYGGNSVTHTNTGDPAPSWEVELSSTVIVDTIVVWNRTDACCLPRLTNFRVSVLDEARDEVFAEDLFTDGVSFPDPSVTVDAGGVEGRFIRVERLGVPEDFPGEFFLSLAEVQVFGEGEVTQPKNLAQRCGTLVSQSTTNGAFTANLAVNGNLGDFTHTQGTDDAASWRVELAEDSEIGRVVLHNRTSCCGSRLRDITVSILDAGGNVVYESELLNPENVLGGGVENVGPPSLTVELQFDGGSVVGRTVVVSRTPDPDLSGTGGTGNADEANVLSLGEVEVCPPVVCDNAGNASCEGVQVTDIQGPDEFGLFSVTVEASASDPDGDALTYAFTVRDAKSTIVDSAGPQDSATATFSLAAGDYSISVLVDDSPDCPDGKSSECSVDQTVGDGGGVGPFLRGDCNGDGGIGGVTDAVFHLGFNFLGGSAPPCLAACDSNGDGATAGVTDPVYLLNYNFLGGSAPPAPFPECATSDDEDDIALGCETPGPCN